MLRKCICSTGCCILKMEEMYKELAEKTRLSDSLMSEQYESEIQLKTLRQQLADVRTQLADTYSQVGYSKPYGTCIS